MKRLIPVMLSVLYLNLAIAQKQNTVVAITDEIPDGKAWVSLRTFSTLSNHAKLLISNSSYKPETGIGNFSNINKALCSGSAAIGFDGKTNRVFYITAIKGDLRYLDLKNGNMVNQVANLYSAIVPGYSIQNGPESQDFIFTRMAMSADGFMYALTNNGKLLIRFNPANPEKIENLGAVSGLDNALSGTDEQNWGGDMISDDKGNLIVFSAQGRVFSVNTTARQATFLGQLQNMPDHFVVSGAAVQQDGSILISSTGGAVKSALLHNLELLKLTPAFSTALSFNSGDLASSYQYKTTDTKATVSNNEAKGSFAVGPNPVVNGRFQISLLNGLPEGSYQIELISMSGKRVFANMQRLSAGKLSNTLQAQNIPAGMYLVKLYNTQHNTAHTQKVVFQ